jgi:hypothetical protein
MTGHLKEKLSVTEFMEQDARRRFLNRQTTEDERAGGEAEVLAGRISLQAHAFNGFQPTEFLLGSQQAGMVLSEDRAGPLHHHTSGPAPVYEKTCAVIPRSHQRVSYRDF